MNTTQPVLIVIAGPAGSGKSTLCDRVIAELPPFRRVVTTTTRPPRAGEVNGVHYHFFTPEEFILRRDRGEFLEWAVIHGKPGDRDRFYGTLASSVLEPLSQGHDLVMNIDVQGVETLRRVAAQNETLRHALFTTFIIVDRERLAARLVGRDTPLEEMNRRLATAVTEIALARGYDHYIESRTREEDFRNLAEFVALCRQRVRLRYPRAISA